MSGPDALVGVTVAGRYQVLARIGGGGFGAVYKVRHVATGGLLALKILHADRLGDDDSVARFQVEARNTHQLQHPNTVRVTDFGRTDDGLLFLATEFLQGRSLWQVLRDEGRLAPARAVAIIGQVLRSLGEAHALGLVHRDVKPANILLVDHFGVPDFVKVLDFGISRALDATSVTTGIIGTPTYMAPEQGLGEDVSPRTDLYAVGCVLHELLVGQPPFVVKGSGPHASLAIGARRRAGLLPRAAGGLGAAPAREGPAGAAPGRGRRADAPGGAASLR
jgi:serine/threonine-protein kinase